MIPVQSHLHAIDAQRQARSGALHLKPPEARRMAREEGAPTFKSGAEGVPQCSHPCLRRRPLQYWDERICRIARARFGKCRSIPVLEGHACMRGCLCSGCRERRPEHHCLQCKHLSAALRPLLLGVDAAIEVRVPPRIDEVSNSRSSPRGGIRSAAARMCRLDRMAPFETGSAPPRGADSNRSQLDCDWRTEIGMQQALSRGATHPPGLVPALVHQLALALVHAPWQVRVRDRFCLMSVPTTCCNLTECLRRRLAANRLHHLAVGDWCLPTGI